MSVANNLQINPSATTSTDPKARTLKAPPEIWELVHETRAEFKPGSALVGHLKTIHPLGLAMILLIIGGVAIFSFITLRGESASSTAAPAAQAERGNIHTVLSPQSTLPKQTAASPAQPTNNAPAPTDTTANTIDEAKTVVAAPNASTETADIKIAEPKVNVAASSATKLIAKPRPQNPTSPTTPNGEKVAARNKDRVQTSSPASVNTRTNNKDVGKAQTAPAPKTEKEQAANRPPAKKEPDKVLSPQLIAPAKASSTPKAKVIAWP